ncbi:MAG: PA2779 family protein [Desulfuromonadales bacterium]|nr:PA2779 family protein [Desulfuromonadales bacterium]
MNSSFRWILNPRIIWSILLAFAVFSISPPPARAALIESQLSGSQVVSQRVVELETVRQALEHEMVAQRLADYGFSKDEVQLKLQTMSDAQLHQLASAADTLAEGGDGLGVVVTVLVIILLVIVILKLSDKQIIVK